MEAGASGRRKMTKPFLNLLISEGANIRKEVISSLRVARC